VKLWKIGMAGLSEVASSEDILARVPRPRAELSPEELKERLRGRLASGAVAAVASGSCAESGSDSREPLAVGQADGLDLHG
jgi:hypothetical protein